MSREKVLIIKPSSKFTFNLQISAKKLNTNSPTPAEMQICRGKLKMPQIKIEVHVMKWANSLSRKPQPYGFTDTSNPLLILWEWKHQNPNYATSSLSKNNKRSCSPTLKCKSIHFITISPRILFFKKKKEPSNYKTWRFQH